MKVLISDKLSDAGVAIFEKAPGIEVINQPGLGKNIEELKKVIADVDAIAIRSGTQLTPEILDCAKNLKVIGRAGIGVDNVDIPYASQKGIIVMNTPGGNVTTTAEHAISMMCALTRNIPQATASMKAGKWEKSKFVGSELCGKTLGVVGAGNIGKIVISRAQGLRMNVIAFDPFLSDEVAEKINVTKVTLGELFAQSDYITVHTPLNDKTRSLINKEAFSTMKKGVYIINCARGGIVNEADLQAALENGIVAGAALDVFEEEPVNPDHPLLKSDKVICTPHLGASTEEAQENVSLDVAEQIVDYLTQGNIVNALNTASASGEVLKQLAPMIDLGAKLGSMHGQLCHRAPLKVQINYYGEISKKNTDAVTSAILQGILKPMLSDDSQINAVNAPFLAKDRGMKIQESKISSHDDFASLVEVNLEFKDLTRSLSGVVFGKHNPRIVRYNSKHVEINPTGQLLVIENKDQPGVVGQVGSCLGDHKINISTMQLALHEGVATSFYCVQGNVSEAVVKDLTKIEGILSVQSIDLE